ncbi:MAG: hypothetical protein ACYDD7_18620 [Acidimicrobiales bacterium]
MIITRPYCSRWRPGAVTIAGQTYSDDNSGSLIYLPESDCPSNADPHHFGVGVVLSKRYSRFRMTIGIADDATCCPVPTVSYSEDSGAQSTPVAVKLGKPDVIDLKNVSTVSRLDIVVEVTDAWTTAMGGAQGMPTA